MRATPPVIAITMGDAAGIGPEVIMKALADPAARALCRPLVVGDAARLREAGARAGGAAARLEVRPVAGPEEGRYAAGAVDCIDLDLIPPGLPWGQLSAPAGEAAFQFVRAATELAVAGRVGAICTAPLNKEALHARRPPLSGPHGDARRAHRHAGSDHDADDAEAARHPRHHPYRPAGRHRPDRAGAGGAHHRPRACDADAGRASRRRGSAVCGINPHAGEHGLFGRGEEEGKIAPAVERCRAQGWDVTGPLPADTLFFRAGRGEFDLVVAMYHDQGHGPVKVLGIEAGVNVTVGLPVIRTSRRSRHRLRHRRHRTGR